MSERQLANLRPFTKGGDPRRHRGGRPPGIVPPQLRKELQKYAHGTKIRQRDMVASRLVQLAVDHTLSIEQVRRAIGMYDDAE